MSPRYTLRLSLRRHCGVVGVLATIVLGLATSGISTASAGQSATTIFTRSSPSADFDASADGSVVAYQEPPDTRTSASVFYAPVYLWHDGRVQRIDTNALRAYAGSSGTINGKGLAVSPDGNVVAYAATMNGHPGTAFYDVGSHARTFLGGYILGYFTSHQGDQLLSSNGRYALLSRGLLENHPSVFGVYDRLTHHFTRLPARHGLESVGLSLSASGSVVLYGELKEYGGQIDTVIYNIQTHQRRTMLRRSEHVHSLSSDGATALIEGGPTHTSGTSSSEYAYTLVSFSAGKITGPLLDSLGGSSLLGGASLSGNGSMIAFACQQTLYLWNPSTGQYSGSTLSGSQSIAAPTVTADGNAVLFTRSASRGLYELPSSVFTPASSPFPAR